MNLLKFIKNQNVSIILGTTSLSYLILMVILFKTCIHVFNRWGGNLKYYSNGEITYLITLKDDPIDVKDVKRGFYNIDEYMKPAPKVNLLQQRIKAQIYLIRSKAITNLRISRDLYYYMTISSTITCISTIVAGICIISITKKGWDSCENSIKGVFLVSIGASLIGTFFGNFFQLQKNADAHMQLYQTYVNLEEQVFTSLAIGYLPESKKQEEVDVKKLYESLVETIGQTLETYSLKIEVDSKSIPKLDDVRKSVEKESLSPR